MLRILIACTLGSIGFPGSASADDPDPKSLEIPAEVDSKARALVAQLASRVYEEREQLTRELRELGRRALPAIQSALRTQSNAEIQLRCEMLLPRAAAEEMKARVDCFLADSTGKFDHKLPGAPEFFEIVGKEEAARNLFREIVLSPNQAMLFSIGQPEELAKVIAARRSQFRPYFGSDDGTGRPNPTAIDIAALLFAEAFSPNSTNVRNTTQSSQFINQPILRTALEGPQKEIYAALFGKWIDTRDDNYSLYVSMNLCKSLKLPLGMKCARKLVLSKTGPPSYRGYGMAFIAQNGTLDDLPILESLLTEKIVLTTTIIGNNAARRVPIQTRDAALALSLLLQKQNPADFDLSTRTVSTNDLVRFNMSQHYIDEDDPAEADKKRDAAIKKYNDWKAAEAAKKKK